MNHVYPAIGVYTAVITAVSPVNLLTSTTVVTVQEAISGLTAVNDSPTIEGAVTNLTATVASGSDVTYSWDYGDGTGGSGTAVSHLYPGIGVYTAVVTASNGVSLVTVTTPVLIEEVISGLIAQNDSPTNLGQLTMLTATVSSGNHVTYDWEFGDGTTGSGPEIAHIYPAAGSYTAVVTASNGVSIISATTSVSIIDQITGLSVTSNSPIVPGGTAVLTATVATGSNVIYSWRFGDGDTGSGPVVNHVYEVGGAYQVVVTATNSASVMSVQTYVIVRAEGHFVFLPIVFHPVDSNPVALPPDPFE